jgi:hypothetical protein
LGQQHRLGEVHVCYVWILLHARCCYRVYTAAGPFRALTCRVNPLCGAPAKTQHQCKPLKPSIVVHLLSSLCRVSLPLEGLDELGRFSPQRALLAVHLLELTPPKVRA